jgi:hypothetical protein
MARVMTSGSVSKAGRPTLGGSEECLSFHQSSTNTYNETKKESRSSMAPSFGESLVHQHTILAPSPFFAITHQTSKKFVSLLVIESSKDYTHLDEFSGRTRR